MVKGQRVPHSALKTDRFLFLDYAWAFLFLWMAFDHALHAYGDYFGKYWFIQDTARSWIADGFYLFDQCIIMPMIFFISGIFVLPSLEKHGLGSYLRERLIRLGIPFCFGVLFIVPALTYPRFLVGYGGDGVSYFDYWRTFLLSEKWQAGPLWVMYGLFLYGAIMAVLTTVFPKTPLFFRQIGIVSAQRPLAAMTLFLILSAVLLGISDLVWGAPWWIGFWRIFYLQGSRFLLYFLYFTAGMIFYAGGFLKDPRGFQAATKKWRLFLMICLGFGGIYVAYSLTYLYDGAFSDMARTFWHVGVDAETLWEVIQIHAPLVLGRTTLLGCVTFFGGLALLTTWYAVTKGRNPLMDRMAEYTYAFFLTHEGIMIWLQWGLSGSDLPILIKFMIVFLVGVSLSWGICYFLMKMPCMRRIFLGKSEKMG